MVGWLVVDAFGRWSVGRWVRGRWLVVDWSVDLRKPETGCIGRFSGKNIKMYPGPSMELFVALVSSFQPLINFTKNPNIGVMGILNAPV